MTGEPGAGGSGEQRGWDEPDPLAELVGDWLASVTFAGDVWVILSFGSEASLALYRWPVLRQGQRILERGTEGYADALIGLTLAKVLGADSVRGVELAIGFDEGTRLAVNLGGSFEDSAGFDAAVLNGVPSGRVGVWTIGADA